MTYRPDKEEKMGPIHDTRKTKATLVSTIALCSALMVAACDSRNVSVDEFLKRAETHRTSGNVRAAMIELKNAVQKEPQNGLARLKLGEAFIDLGDGVAAEIELRRARDANVEPDTTTVLLAESKFLQRKFEDVIKQLDPEALSSQQAKASAYALRGKAYFALRQPQQANEAFNAALAADPASIDAIAGAARLALSQGDMTRAQSLTAKSLELGPKDPKSLLLQGEIAFYLRDYETSQRAYEQALKMHRADATTYGAAIGLARAQIAAGKNKEAIDTLAPVLKAAPRDIMTNYLRALAAYQMKDYKSAQSFSEVALATMPDHRPSMFLAGASSYALGAHERAAKYLGTFVAQVPENLEARKLLAEIQVKLGEPSNALKTLTSGLPKSGQADPQLLSMIGTVTAQSGDLSGARNYLEKAVAAQPADATSRARLGVTRIALGDTAEGIEDLEKASKLDSSTWQADFALVSAYLQARDYDKALEAAKRLQARQPNNPNALTLIGVAYVAKGDIANAKAAFKRANELSPGDRAALRNLATIAVQEQQFDQARGYYDEILKKNPKDADILVAYSRLEARAGRPKEQLARIEQAAAANPESTGLRFELARTYLILGEAAKALATAKPVLEQNPNESGFLEVAGRAQLALGQYADATATFKTLAAANPTVPASFSYLAMAYEGAGDVDQALAEAEKALKLAPADAIIRFDHARLLARSGKVEQANKILAELRAEAVESYQRAFKAQPNNTNLVALARAQTLVGRMGEAVQSLEEWVQQKPDDLFVRSSLAEMYLATQKFADAEAQYAAINQRAPNNALVLNNLAWVMTEQGRARDALPLARRAVELAPDSVNALDTLGYTLMRENNVQEAVAVLRKAADKAPNEPSVQIRYAQALARDGKATEAKDVLRKVIADERQARGRADAEKLLRELGG